MVNNIFNSEVHSPDPFVFPHQKKETTLINRWAKPHGQKYFSKN